MEQSKFDKLSETVRKTLIHEFNTWQLRQDASDYAEDTNVDEIITMFLESLF